MSSVAYLAHVGRRLFIIGIGALLSSFVSRAPRSQTGTLRLDVPVLRHEIAPRSGQPVRVAHFAPDAPAKAVLPVDRPSTLWLATPRGIVRYDKNARAALVPVIDIAGGANALARDGEEHVVVATDRGLIRATVSTATRVQTLLHDRRVTAIDGDWAGTWDGVFAWRDEAVVPATIGWHVTAVRQCGDYLYIATQDRGLFAIQAKRGGTPAPRLLIGDAQTLSPCFRNRALFAAGVGGIHHLDRGRVRDAGAPIWREHATALARDGDSLLFAAPTRGVFEYDGQHVRRLVARPRVTMIHRDGARGPLLVATEAGLTLFTTEGDHIADIARSGPAPSLITAILPASNGTLYAGSFDRGLDRFDGERFIRCPLGDERITTLIEDADRRVWVGTAAGLERTDEHGRFAPFADPQGWLRGHIGAVRSEGRTVLIGTHAGVVAINLDHIDRPRYFVGGPTAYGIARWASALWTGSDAGLVRIDPTATTLSMTDLGGVLPDNWITDVRSSASANAVFVLTLRSGLLRLSRERADVWPTSLMTSPSGLVVAGEKVLFGTNARGLAVLDHRGLHTYGPAEGVASPLIASLARDAAGRIWLGGAHGIDRIDQIEELK